MTLMRIVFSFAVGNPDMHFKNFSLTETDEHSGECVSSAALMDVLRKE